MAGSAAVFLLLGFAKWWIAGKLESTSMKKDAVCSLAAAVCSIGMMVSILAHRANDDLWWFDGTVALVVAVLLLVYGARTILCHGHKWWTKQFWTGELPTELESPQAEQQASKSDTLSASQASVM